PNDESAEVLLKKIREEKAEKIKKGELKADKKDSFIFVGSDKRHYEQFADGTVKDIEDEIPFEVPKGWAVARMGTYITFTGGAQPPKETFEYSPNEDNIRLIQIRDYKTDAYATYIPKKLARRFCSKTDVMIGRYGPPLFQILRGIEGAYNVAIMKAEAVPEIMQNDYLYYMLQDGTLLHFLESLSDRTYGQDGVNMFELNNYLILIPPYDEQRRIIKKLEETFPIIESLEKNIDDLKVAIKHAKSKILDLAIHGKLVPQDPKDEPAEELLKRIATSDNRPYEKVEDECIPFEVPASWQWSTIKNIVNYIGDGDWIESKDQSDKGIRLIQTGNIGFGTFKDKEGKYHYISENTFTSLGCNEIFEGDILISRLPEPVGRACILPKLPERMITAVDCTIIRLNEELFQKELFVYYTISNKYLELIKENCTGTTRLRISRSNLEKILVPIPPLKEQKRILDRIKELFASLDEIILNLI
ncbi:MAG: restriction endonuclease subunit S, partial [Treponema sp.]|nr:restriction endonuclease subunit S [Treponema sp.]